MRLARGPLVSYRFHLSWHERAHIIPSSPTFQQRPVSDAAKESVLSLDVIDAAASKSGLTTSGADEKVRRPEDNWLENKRQSPSLSPSPTSGLSDAETREVAEVRVAGTY